MPDERTRRFDRLLAMRRQLERLSQWRLAAARRERLEGDGLTTRASEAVELRITERLAMLGADVEQGTLRTSLVAEKRAEHELREARTLAAGRLQAERKFLEALVAAQRQTKQTERLTESAHRAVDEAEQRTLQIEWDEHGRRKDRKGIAPPPIVQVANLDTDDDRESLP
jgi:hypothetical protein